MTPDRHRQVSDIFQQATELPEGQRAAYLAQACGGDDGLFREVESLLNHHYKEADAFDDRNVGVGRKLVGAPPPAQHLLPSHVGRFRIIRRIGEGGMGVVFEAEQDNPKRVVALKVIRAGLASDSVVRRFRHEAEVLGRLQHLGIADVYDAGVAETPLGQQPYFAMQYVHGLPLIEYAKQRQLDTNARLELFVRVCDAVHYAHQRGVIHRDLKPANILVVDEAPKWESGNVGKVPDPGESRLPAIPPSHIGQPKILDFGVARVTDDDMTIATMQTATGQVIGTLPYMSPEQVSGKAADVDTRSDVYSLGVTLYELLAERLPYRVSNCTLPEAARIIADVEPTHLSTIDRRFRGDVDTIVIKALQKDRDQRYQSVAELAADIRRYLSDQPVQARPPSAMYQLRKFARRNKALVGGALGIFLALIIGFLGMWWFAAGESQQKATAEAASREARRLAYRVSVNAAADAIEDHNLSAARRLLQESPAELRGWEWLHLSTRLDDSKWQIQGNPPPGGWLQLRDDGKLIQSTLLSALLIDTEAGKIVKRFDSAVPSIAVTQDGRRAAVLSGPITIKLVEFDGDACEPLGEMTSPVKSLRFSNDGNLLAAGGENNSLRLYNLRSGTIAWNVTLPRLSFDLSFSPDGRWLATRDVTGFQVVDLRDGRLVYNIDAPGYQRFTASFWSIDGQLIFSRAGQHRHSITPIRLSDGARLPNWPEHHRELLAFQIAPDGQSALTAYNGGLVRLHDVRDGAIQRELVVEGGSAAGLSFSPDGKSLAYGELNGLIQLENRATGRRIATLRGQDSPAASILFSADGKTLFAGAAEGMIRAWDISNAGERDVLRGHESYVYPVVFSPDGATLASGSWDGTIRLWTVATQTESAVLTGHSGYVRSLAWSPDGRHLLSATLSGDEEFVWNLASRSYVRIPPRATAKMESSAFFKNGKYIWLPGKLSDGESAYSMETGKVESLPVGALRDLLDDRVSPDGKWLARLIEPNGRLTLVSLQSPGTTRELAEGMGRAVFSPDGKHLIAAIGELPSPTQTPLGVWDVATGTRLADLSGHIGTVFDIRFSPDGLRFATCGRDATIRIWDAAAFDQLARLQGHLEYVWSIAWSPDGRTLASGSGDQTVRIWRSQE